MVKMVNVVTCMLPTMSHHFTPARMGLTERTGVGGNVKKPELSHIIGGDGAATLESSWADS